MYRSCRHKMLTLQNWKYVLTWQQVPGYCLAGYFGLGLKAANVYTMSPYLSLHYYIFHKYLLYTVGTIAVKRKPQF